MSLKIKKLFKESNILEYTSKETILNELQLHISEIDYIKFLKDSIGESSSNLPLEEQFISQISNEQLINLLKLQFPQQWDLTYEAIANKLF